MAHEIEKSDLLTPKGGLAREALSDTILQQLHDPTDLTRLCVRVPWQSLGSGTLDVTQDAKPGAYTARTSEISGASIANSEWDSSRFSLTPAGYSKRYQVTDLIPIAGGYTTLGALAAKLVAGVGITMTDLLCALFPSVASSVTPGTGVALDVSTMYDAQFALNTQSVPGPWAAVLSQKQVNNFQASLRSEAGAAQFIPATADLLRLRGPGVKGTWNGIEITQSDSVEASGGNAQGCMFGFGAFAYTFGNAAAAASQVPPGLLYMANEIMMIEINRDQTNFMTALIASIFPSVVEAEDLRAVQILSDE